MLASTPDDRLRAGADLAACRALLRTGSRSFHAAARLLPRAVADPATALYAFCRAADDAIDSGRDPARALDALNARLDRCYAGRPADDPVDRAFARTVAAHAIPRALPEGLLEGMAWDAEGRRYETLGDLQAYAARVAGTVGAMMTVVMGRRDPEVLARACDLGVAMQLTNIARDVGEDAGMGRVYLPLAWLAEEGVCPDRLLADPRPSPGLARAVARLLAAADPLYDRSAAGVAALPAACRPGIDAARRLYAAIGREVERRGCDSVSSRAVVSGRRKAGLAGLALLAALPGQPKRSGAGLPQVRFILDAVAALPPAARAREPGPLLRLLALFERLERGGAGA